MTTTVAIVSGGMDSVTLAHALAADGDTLHLLSVDYGQRHRRELADAEACALRLGARWHYADLRGVRELLGRSALTDPATPVPYGHYAAPTMAITVVPNRNALLLALAYGLAVTVGADRVATAVHAGDHYVYPDCRPAFLDAFAAMERLATAGHAAPGLHLHAPFAHQTKAAIVRVGHALGVPWAATWSCYEGGAVHCGRCGTCVERREAFTEAAVPDPTEYAA
jgi:7-cyano-7-deazaguanine synthase